MKVKYLIILVLMALLGFVVARMMRLEERIRKSKVVEIVREDINKPLMKEMALDQLTRLADSSSIFFRANTDYLSALTTRIINGEQVQKWEDVFIKGVNLGVALPGHWPSEFSASYDDYLQWFILIGRMNANTIRTYTILPPDFYRALAWYNLHYEKQKIWLLQGVWASEPPHDNYADPGYTREFLKEIRDAIDVVHGNIVIPPRKGHADGIYAADVSRYTLGWALGREWEPVAVTTTNKNDTIGLSYGVFIDVLEGSPMEKWLAGVMEFTARYETQTYMAQRPISFINWLTLDPMYHNKELGADDLDNVDIEKFTATNLFKPGLFASYHVYPYYPDFIFLEDKYKNTLNHRGKPDNFLAYLTDLKKHQQGMPLVIAEYGVPSSRGSSHYTPFDYKHGGYSEQEQADMTVLMTEDIHQSGCAGGVCFEWIDEWFKNNWLVQPFEEPQESRKKWHNVENPEQNYGILALEARKKIIDGKPDDWKGSTDKPFIAADADAAYFYLAINMPGFDFKNNNLFVAIDTYNKNLGDFHLPFLKEPLKRGAEFLLEIKDTGNARVLVDNFYNIFADITKPERPGCRSVKNYDGKFVEQWMYSNPPRVDVLGDTSERKAHNRGKLQFGNILDPRTSNAGICWNKKGFVELRISWQTLNVSDPSTRSVLNGAQSDGSMNVTTTDGFHFRFFITDKKNHPVKKYPNDETLWFTWDTWDIPEYQVRIKPVYHSLAKIFSELEPIDSAAIQSVSPNHRFSLCNFYHGKPGAITFAFDGRCYSQFSNAAPALRKYNLKATFAKTYYGPPITGGTHYLQMMDEEYNKLIAENHEVRPDGPWVVGSGKGEKLVASPWKDSHPFTRIFGDNKPTLHQVDSILQKGAGTWNILVLRHVYDPATKEYANLIHLGGKEVQNISPEYLDKLIRVARNTGFWIAPFDQVSNYLYVRDHSKIIQSGYNTLFFVKVSNQLGELFNTRPVSVAYSGPARLIRVKGSASDGTFRVKGGILYIDLWPNTEATIEILE
jgi:hypothetical protein